MIPNKTQLAKLLLEILTEKYKMRKPKKQKVKITKNKPTKNKMRKPKKVRENDDIWNNLAFHNTSPELQKKLKELYQIFIERIMNKTHCTKEQADIEWIKAVSNFGQPNFSRN